MKAHRDALAGYSSIPTDLVVEPKEIDYLAATREIVNSGI
jgi:hypothetical protein